MDSLGVIILVGSVALCIGALIGAFFSRRFMPPAQAKELERRLQSSKEELSRYQQEVADHFSETSRLIGNLSHSYREVHEHLSRKALQLASPEVSKQMLEAGDKLGLETGNIVEQASVEPPRDWAPKTPGETGTLSEEFGLRDEREEPGIEVLTAVKREQEKKPE